MNTTPVPIFQHQAELDDLLELYRLRKPQRVLEVGTFHGGTLYHWLQNAQPNATIVTVDTYTAGIDNRHLYAQWTPAGVELVVIHGNSHRPSTIAKTAEHGPYDWLFIDAGHYYEEVRNDWLAYGPLVEPGGLIAFHDILTHESHPEIQVGRLWRQLVAQGYQTQEIIRHPDAAWGGIGLLVLPVLLDEPVNSIPDRDVGNPENERWLMTETVEEPTEPEPDPDPDPDDEDEDDGA